jgi:F0F1-type ATP synthase assembly protein I
MKNNTRVYALKYAGMAFQMAAILMAAVFAGKALDRYFLLSFPFFTLVLVLFGTFAALYLPLKDFFSTDKGK